MSHWNRPAALEGAQWSLTQGAIPSIENIVKSVDEDDTWDFQGDGGEKSAQSVGVIREILKLQDEYWRRRQKILTTSLRRFS